ncbi:sp110 nuclear body protein-like isoform X2 [Pseudophryne corroboree]|uniref:sp110 nuclear body protein-like isoform X2 n=1 Tax=Pseudophryne corroboree TaxID=495146 RepID=UPI003081FE93
MDEEYEYFNKPCDVAEEYTSKQYSLSAFDHQWFYAKSKVQVCLAITECLPFLQELKDAGFLSEEESLELQADTRSVHRVVYESLCWIEEKNISLQRFFEHLFQESYLKRYPDLRPVLQEYNEKKSRDTTPGPPDTESDHLIFAQEKVPICLAITDRFPFLHGLQDLTILSEAESLKLQADERPVQRVIYECLSVIEKKDMKLNVVFEYIFQECYLKVYPVLQDMLLQEPNEDQAGPFNGKQFPNFSRPEDLLDFFKHNKMYICEAIDERFPILHGLQDKRMLTKLQMLMLQADKRPTKEVLYEALGFIEQRNNIDLFFAYVFQEYYLDLFPDLNIILQSLNDALKLEIYPPSSDLDDTVTAPFRRSRTKQINYVSCPDQVKEVHEQDSSGSSTDLDDTVTAPVRRCRTKQINYAEPPDYDLDIVNGRKRHKDLDDTVTAPIRKCRTKQINYTEPPDYELELVNGRKRHKVSRLDQANEIQEQKSSGSSTDLDDAVTAPIRKCRTKQISYTEPPDDDLETVSGRKIHKAPECTLRRKYKKRRGKDTKFRKQKGRKWDTVSHLDQVNEQESSGSSTELDDAVTAPIRKCRTKQISYTEPPDDDLETVSGRKIYKAPEYTLRRKYKKRRGKDTKFRNKGRKWDTVAKNVAVKLEFPKQVFSDSFQVRCGKKKGLFLKKRWTGDSRYDKCIRSEGNWFTVTKFEKYGGKEASKNWKKTISCERIPLETLIRSAVLKSPKPSYLRDSRKTL